MGLAKDIRKSMEDRGLKGPSALFLFIFNYLKNYIFCVFAQALPNECGPFLQRTRGAKIGKNVFIDRTAILDGSRPENITIEDDARITAGVIIMTHIKAGWGLRQKGYVPFSTAKVKICKHSFIGVGAIILPGVTVGEGALVVSGSVVSVDVPPHTVVSGNPAKILKRFE